MAGTQDDMGAMFTAGVSDVQCVDEIIKDMAFDYSGDMGREYYPYPTSMSLGEPDADSQADKESAYFLDVSRLPSPFIYEVETSKRVNLRVMDEKAKKREAHNQRPKERSKCDKCSTSFARKSDLRRHAVTHHSPQFTYKCTIRGCTKEFYRKDKFQEHVRRVHEYETHRAVDDVVQKAIHQYLRDAKSLESNPEDCASKGTSTGQSFWTSLDMQMRHFLGIDATASIRANQYSYKSSAECETTFNGSSTNGSLLSPSTSSNRNISCKDPKEVDPVNSAGETGPARLGLACPYRKYNPVDYNIHSHTTCATSSWDSVTRVKEHLIRHHRAPFQCTRCWTCFPAEIDLSIHVESTDLCEKRHISPAEGMTPDVERRIRSRRRRDQSETKKWEEIYTILFPEEKEIPSPYFVPIGDDAAAASDKFPQFPPLLFSCIDSQTQLPLILPAPVSQPSTKWAPFPNASCLREKFPLLFRSRLEGALARDGAPMLDTTLKSQILDIVTECCDEILLAEESNHSPRDVECDDREHDLSMLPAGHTLLPATESMVINSLPNSDGDMASYCMDFEMNSLR